MEYLFRVLFTIIACLATFVNSVLNLLVPRKKPTFRGISNKLLTTSVSELVVQLARKEITSEELVRAYIERIEEVNPCLNAVVDRRYAEAIEDAKRADNIISKTTGDIALVALYTHYPILGIPFTVKEACSVKGLSFVVGSVLRKGIISRKDGEVVQLLRAAGGIPLLVSANPEFCLSFETNTHTNGKCVNPYDLRRTAAGSSAGEGALNGSGATTFGLGSDIGGSIRIPAMFCGVFGHKPTGGLTSVAGHFPNSTTDAAYPIYLQMGPITRFARDLPLLLQIMAGDKKDMLKFNESVKLTDIKIFYACGFDGLNGLSHPKVDFDIELEIIRAVKCFEKIGMQTEKLDLKCMQNSTEIGLIGLCNLTGCPSIITQDAVRRPTRKTLFKEFMFSLIGQSIFTTESLFLELMQSLYGLTCPRHMAKYRKEAEKLKAELTQLLGKNGVLFFPTFHTSALCFHTSIINGVGIDMLLLFNILGFPSTTIPMGLNRRNMPIGFQVIAAPFQDKLCLQIAAELEGAFGGWIPPVPHEFE